MLMKGRILVGSLREFKTKKGDMLPKASVKVVDMGAECSSDVTTYWIDFLGDAAPNQVELDSIMGEEFLIEIRLARASKGSNGNAYLNVAGGAILDGDHQAVQSGLRQRHMKKAS